MEYRIYKLQFHGAVHIGDTELSEHEYSLRADTLFSALAIEAMKQDGADGMNRLVSFAKSGALLLTDAFPYVGSDLFLPKPIVLIERGERGADSDGQKKAFKNLKYMRVCDIAPFLGGSLKPQEPAKILSKLGEADVQTKAAVRTGGDAEPYHVGVFGFAKNAGLYFIAGGNDETFPALETALDGLSESGVGGKRSSGFGRFTWRYGEASEMELFSERLTGESARRMAMSVCLPKDDELDAAMDGASYLLERRGGFVYSETYSSAEPLRKNDLYVFAAGSVFVNQFCGDVYDVGNGGAHPVWRYAKALTLGLD